MSRIPSDLPREPLVAARDTHLVASLLNRAAAAFDIAALSVAEAIFLADILDRAIRALWLAHDHDLRIHLGGSSYQPFPEQDELDDDYMPF